MIALYRCPEHIGLDGAFNISRFLLLPVVRPAGPGNTRKRCHCLSIRICHRDLRNYECFLSGNPSRNLKPSPSGKPSGFGAELSSGFEKGLKGIYLRVGVSPRRCLRSWTPGKKGSGVRKETPAESCSIESSVLALDKDISEIR